ncbi:MAG TPA: class I SAM-dependent methyltransferase [Bryobacteraceae bacterium]|nr:class I SAM-dependent methyltransferase [Bryobacteraceae bacterium]
MNSRHSGVTDWGLSHVAIGERDTILDVGCGGGRTLSKLAAAARQGKVYGIDHSQASVAVATKANRPSIEAGRVGIQEASVSELPFPGDMFDLVTAVETHFWWPNLAAGVREIFRVLKPGGRLLIIAEVYKGASSITTKLVEKQLPLTGMKLLSVEEHRELLASAGYGDIEVGAEQAKGWIYCTGRKALSSDWQQM